MAAFGSLVAATLIGVGTTTPENDVVSLRPSATVAPALARGMTNIVPILSPNVPGSPTWQKVQEAQNTVYIASPERNQNITNSVMSLATRIVKAGDKSKLGYFDFRNAENNTLKSKVSPRKNAGWGILEHRPEYPGAKNLLVSLTVYRKSDGTYDLTKGVYDMVTMDTKTGTATMFSLGNTPIVWGKPANQTPQSSSWKVAAGHVSGVGFVPDFESGSTAGISNIGTNPTTLAAGEKAALSQAADALNAAGLPK